MGYYLQLSSRYLRKHWSRTIYTVFGVLLTFLLVFAGLTTGYSYWDYSLEVCYSGVEGRTQLSILDPCTAEEAEKISKVDSVSELVLLEELASEPFPVSLEELDEDKKYYVYIGLKDVSNLQQSAQELQDHLGVEVLVKGDVEMYLNQGDSVEQGLYNSITVILGAVIAVFSIFVLRNILMISVVERMQDYGLMRCVGMSQKQLYVLLAVEGTILGSCGVVGGVVCGYGILQMIAVWLNHILKLPVAFHFGFYPEALIYTVVFCLAGTFFSLLEPARQAGMISPIEAIHSQIALRNRRGGLRETIRFHNGRLWGRLFGAPGEYAYKNMMRSRGRFVYLFLGMLVCMALIGCINSFGDSMLATVKNLYQGQSLEYAETIAVNAPYSEELYEEIRGELEEIDGVQDTGRIFCREQFSFYDKKLASQDLHFCLQYAYDKSHFERLEPYLIAGSISFEKMERENGVILCDSVYNTRDEEGNLTDQRLTDYRVGDTVSLLTTEAYAQARNIFERAVKQAAKKKGIEPVLYDNTAGSESSQEITPDMFDVEQPGFRKLLRETVRLLRQQGYDCAGWDELSEYEGMYQLQDDLEEFFFQQGKRDDFVIQGIVSEDIFNGGNRSMGDQVIRLLQPDTTILAEPSEIRGEPQGFHWLVGLTRDEKKLDQSVEQYCRKKSTGKCVLSYENMADQYMEMLLSMKVARVVAGLVGGCIAMISFIQIFNTVCASMLLRRKELWLYEVVGMSRRQERRMIVLENSVAAFFAVGVGYLMAWGISWYFVEYLLNQDEFVQFMFPFWKNIAFAGLLFLLSVAVSLLARRSARQNK